MMETSNFLIFDTWRYAQLFLRWTGTRAYYDYQSTTHQALTYLARNYRMASVVCGLLLFNIYGHSTTYDQVRNIIIHSFKLQISRIDNVAFALPLHPNLHTSIFFTLTTKIGQIWTLETQNLYKFWLFIDYFEIAT